MCIVGFEGGRRGEIGSSFEEYCLVGFTILAGLASWCFLKLIRSQIAVKISGLNAYVL